MAIKLQKSKRRTTGKPADTELEKSLSLQKTSKWLGVKASAVRSLVERLCLLLVLLVVGPISAGCSLLSVEEPPFDIVSQNEQFEVREYPSQLVAEVRTTGNQKEAANSGFRLLADYIFGNNTTSDKIAMTAPVAQSDTSEKENTSEKIAMTAPVAQVEESRKIAMTAPVAQVEANVDSQKGESTEKQTWVIRVTMPENFTLETIPKPNNPAVVIREIPQRTMAVMKFSGYARVKTVDKKRAALAQAVSQAGLTMQQDIELAQYNPPWTPGFLRRNEVMVQIEPKSE